jgi:dolichol-phosphate mannosyltransferase
MKLSVVIPAHNEEETVAETVGGLVSTLAREEIDHEVIVVDDSSADGTAAVVERIGAEHPQVRCLPSPYRNGFGFAVRAGLEAFEGDAVAIVMADGSDSPADLVSYHRLLEEGYECAFGSRFVHGSTVLDYPRSKLIMNRIVNFGIRLLFRHGYNDTTNAFKAYRREVIENVQPFLSHHFNLTVELPLKAVVRGYSYGIVPISWTNRKAGVSKLSLNEMGSRYLFIVLYVFLEHHLSRGDYLRDGLPSRRPRGTWRAGKRAREADAPDRQPH